MSGHEWLLLLHILAACVWIGGIAVLGDHAEAARRLRHWAWGMAAILALLVLAVWDMVAKPGL